MQTVDRVLDVLEALVGSEKAVGVTELSERLGVAKANVYRVLASLERRGYATQDPVTSRYVPGLRCMELGSAAAYGKDLREVAASYLHQLVAATEETVQLAVYQGGDAVYIDKLDSPQPVAPKTQVGVRAPATCVATGRALLAFQPHYEIDRVLSEPVHPFSSETIIDPAQLRQLLVSVRTEGFATNRNSWRQGVCGLAAPIRDHSGAVVAAVGCCVPESRFAPSTIPRIRSATLEAAHAISSALGYVLPPHAKAASATSKLV